MDAIDQHLCAELQPFPVINQSDITLVDLMASTSDEETIIAAHPLGRRGHEIPNDPEDNAKGAGKPTKFLDATLSTGKPTGR